MSECPIVVVEEHVHGNTVWVAIRARGADWSWLTEDEAAELGRAWTAKYAAPVPAPVEERPLLRIVSNSR